VIFILNKPVIRTNIKVSNPCPQLHAIFLPILKSEILPKRRLLETVNHQSRRTPPSRCPSIEQSPSVAPLHQKKNNLRVQRWELLSIGTSRSVVDRLPLMLRLLAAWDLSSCWETAINGVVEESSNVVDEEGVKQLSDLFLVGKLECTLKGNPGR
jgi:hypothetical protein